MHPSEPPNHLSKPLFLSVPAPTKSLYKSLEVTLEIISNSTPLAMVMTGPALLMTIKLTSALIVPAVRKIAVFPSMLNGKGPSKRSTAGRCGCQCINRALVVESNLAGSDIECLVEDGAVTDKK